MISTTIVKHVSTKLARGSTRRSFLVKTAVIGAALATNPMRYLLRPGTAYAAVCGPGADCGSGWTVFCCSINGGSNTCPPNTVPAGWWKTDGSAFCGGRPRYILDCNAMCGGCGCGQGGICDAGCHPDWGCHCGSGSCDQRRVACNHFRYGQCHQEIPCVGPVVCRVATCTPPWEWDPTCTTASATANQTGPHTAPCLDGATAGIAAFGAALDHGEPQGLLRAPVVGIESTRSGAGYWMVGDDGGIFAFGDAPFLGSTGDLRLNRPIVDIAVTATGDGLLARRRRRRHLRVRRRAVPRLDRRQSGSTARSSASPRHQPATATGSPPTTAACSRFGDARFHGSTGGSPAQPPDRRHRRDTNRQRLLDGRRRRRRLLPSATRSSTAGSRGRARREHPRDRGDANRPWLLDAGCRRWRLLFRRRPVLRQPRRRRVGVVSPRPRPGAVAERRRLLDRHRLSRAPAQPDGESGPNGSSGQRASAPVLEERELGPDLLDPFGRRSPR